MGLSESPNPGWSTAMTRKRPASATTVVMKEPLVAPRPCRARIGGAGAGFHDGQARPGRADAAKAQAPGLGVAAGGGQEADADVHVVAHLQPARAVGVH